MTDYMRGYQDGESLRSDYDARGDEYTVPTPDLNGESPTYQKGWWDGFNKLQMTPPHVKPDWFSPTMKASLGIR